MKKIKNKVLELWNDESAQGATEYILLLVVIVGLALAFRRQITQMVNDKLTDLSGGIGSFTIDQ